MASQLIELPLLGNGYRGSFDTAADLPAQAGEGQIAYVLDEEKLYSYQSGVWGPSSSGVTDHGALTGLGDDDHPQYLLANGTRALSGNWNAGAFSVTADDLVANNTVTADDITANLSLTSGTITADSIELNDGIIGDTTGVPAGSGFVGETIVSEDTSFGTTNVAASGSWGYAHSSALSAGIWLVSGTIGIDDNGAVVTTAFEGALSTSATGVGITANFTTRISAIYQGEDLFSPVPHIVFASAAPFTVYLNTKFYYTSGTPQHKGQITAIRIR